MIPINNNNTERLASGLGEDISKNFTMDFKEGSAVSAESMVLHVVISDLKKLESQSMTLFDMIKKTDENYKIQLNKICCLSDKRDYSKSIAELKAKSGALNKLREFAFNNINSITKLKTFRLNNDKEFLSAIGAINKSNNISKAIIELTSFESLDQLLSIDHMVNLKTSIMKENRLDSLIKKIDKVTFSKLLVKFSEIVDRDNIISDLSVKDKMHLFQLMLTGESFEKINLAKIEAINSVLNPTVEKKEKSESFLSWLF